MSSQRFCLRWNNHQTNLLSVFDQLLHAETFTDVTLAVEGQLLKAHKMVLSACSPYFQALFVNHQEKHPIVILKDVPYSDMKSLLDFMYRGEVSVDQERLTAFLRVAESLRIKGLTEVNEDKSESSSLCGSLGPPPQLHRLHRERDRSIQHQQQQMNQQNNAGLLLPLLGGGSMQPKRKRGRPRKLSGGEEMLDQNVVRTVEPERLEVSVGAESFQTDEPPSGDEEALLIDEGDDMHRAQSPQNHSEHHAAFRKYLKRSISTQSDGDLPNATPVITVELLTKPKPERTDSHSENKSNVDEPETTISSADRKTTIKLQDFARSQGESMLDRFKDSKKGAGLCRSLSERHESIRSQLEAGKTSIKLSRSLSERHEASKSLLDSVGEQRDVSELTEEDAAMLLMDNRSGVHFLTEDQASSLMYPNVETSGADGAEENEAMSLLRIRCKQELLEYVVRGDGRVVCKLCGEVLQSRTHWYRHKYKLHAHTPQGLFKCEHCSVFFKSRKGYIGHLSSRHPESDSGAAEASPSFSVEVLDIKQEPLDPEAVIPSCELPTTHCNKKLKTNKGAAAEGAVGEGVEWEQQRRREERLVADIIARVRRECEAAGAPGGARRGYSRRSALTNG